MRFHKIEMVGKFILPNTITQTTVNQVTIDFDYTNTSGRVVIVKI